MLLTLPGIFVLFSVPNSKFPMSGSLVHEVHRSPSQTCGSQSDLEKKSVPKWSTRDQKCLGCGYLEYFTRSLYSRWSNYSTHRDRSIRVKLIRSNRCWRIFHGTFPIFSTSVGLDFSSVNDANALVLQLERQYSVSCLDHHSRSDLSRLTFLRRWFRTALAGWRLSARSICCACC